jgi:hypothetical protein
MCYIVMYLGAIVAANLLVVEFGPSVTIEIAAGDTGLKPGGEVATSGIAQRVV